MTNKDMLDIHFEEQIKENGCYPRYAAVQNGVILDVFSAKENAKRRIEEEKQKDFISIMFTRKLRKLFKKSGNIALHNYSVITIVSQEELT